MNAPNQPSDADEPRSETTHGSESASAPVAASASGSDAGESGSDAGESGSDAGESGSGVVTATLLDPIVARQVEEADRKRPIPGGEPECPLCSTKMVRRVERHPAPHGGASPFRVRLMCPGESCGAWTVYDW